jgi:hypothetical protein
MTTARNSQPSSAAIYVRSPTNGFLNATGNPGVQDYYFMHQYEHSNLATDVPHRVSGTATYPLPFGKGKRFGNNMPGWANEAAGGWTVTSIIGINSGFPLGADRYWRSGVCRNSPGLHRIGHPDLWVYTPTFGWNGTDAELLQPNRFPPSAVV